MGWRDRCSRRSAATPQAGDLTNFRSARSDLVQIVWHDGIGMPNVGAYPVVEGARAGGNVAEPGACRPRYPVAFSPVVAVGIARLEAGIRMTSQTARRQDPRGSRDDLQVMAFSLFGPGGERPTSRGRPPLGIRQMTVLSLASTGTVVSSPCKRSPAST
jgi:hypothetical protein